MEPDDPLRISDASHSELDRVLGELVERANDVLATQGRLRALLKANEAIVQDLELETVLQRIIEVAAELVGAKYGALGVIAPGGGLEQFITTGLSPEHVARIGDLPHGHGLLGALIDDPRPIRLEHLAADGRSAGFPAAHPPMESFLGVPIRVRDEVFGNLYLTNRSDGRFSAEDEELVVALAATAGFAIENARLFAETKRRQAWSAASAEITAALLSDSEEDSLSLVAARVLSLADADFVTVSVPTDDPAYFVVATSVGDRYERFDRLRFPIDGTLTSRVLESKQPLLIDEYPSPLEVEGESLSLGPTMTVPLLASDRVLGVLYCSRNLGRQRFTRTDLEMAADFAGQASLAIELAVARADQQRMALLEDRGRIARDLHDNVIQQLFATGLELQMVGGSLPARAAQRVEQAVDRIDAAITQVRTAVFALNSESRERSETVRHRLIDVASDISSGLPGTPQVSFAGPVDLVITGGLADDVVAVVREALSNVAKHARATQVSVRVSVGDGVVSVEVIDNGVGIPAKRRRSGTANLETRAVSRGGSFSLESSAGETRLHWTAPFEEGDR